MSITDELREWAKTLTHWWYDPVKDEYTYTTGTKPPSIDAIRLDSNIIAIADRIDAEHEAQLNDAFETRNSDENLENDGWIRLPKDVDGVPIHVGDVMAYADNTKPMEVVALVPPAVFLTEDGPRYADMCRHYHAPTVEDVLREFALKAAGRECMTMRSDLVDEYAARLQLREDA